MKIKGKGKGEGKGKGQKQWWCFGIKGKGKRVEGSKTQKVKRKGQGIQTVEGTVQG